jgi:predicted RNase H-like HicB family nuclease
MQAVGVGLMSLVRLAPCRSASTRSFFIPSPTGGFRVSVPELPSEVTQGETEKEARAMARDATEGYLEVVHADRLPVPRFH